MTYVAVDIDGTLTFSNISFLFGKYLYEKRVISLFSALWLIVLYVLHKTGFVSIETLHRKVFSFLFKGSPLSLFEKLSEEFFHSHSGIFRKEVLAEVLERKKRGERIVLLSASPDFLAAKVAKLFSFEEWHATEYLVDERGFFSILGRIMTGEEKASLVKKAREGFKDRLVAMTDSSEDLPLLRMADEVLVVTSCRALLKEAREKNWRVLQ